MSEIDLKFTGWKAVVAIVVILGLMGLRLMTFSDKTDDKVLIKQIELQLLTDYFPNDVDKLKAALETGDSDTVESVAKSVTTTRLNVESIKASYPPFDFSTPKKVVVKADYSLNDASGVREKGTKFYLFRHGSLTNNWQYQHRSSVISYYLNFL